MSTQTMKSKTGMKPAGESPAVAEDAVDRLAGLLPAEELAGRVEGPGA